MSVGNQRHTRLLTRLQCEHISPARFIDSTVHAHPLCTMLSPHTTRRIIAAICVLLGLSTAAGAQHAERRNPHVPEPLMFDLVRGLGARKGELEVNALTVHDFRAGADKFYWNPEIEWVVADGLALEIELAMDRGHLESTKLMSQLTFGTPLPNRYIHGAQVIAERSGIDGGYDLSTVYIGAGRFSPTWSFNVIQGAKYGAGIEDRRQPYWSWLGNATLFREARRATFGLELNVENPRSESPTVRLTPQVHVHRGAWAAQGGIGVSSTAGTRQSLASLRIIRTLAEPQDGT